MLRASESSELIGTTIFREATGGVELSSGAALLELRL